ncbi:hypothetical protein ACHHYP_02084 [Achlya hypogyna]|uniref:Transmembrane protein n=1 Tax=Achlya hypogyna TaxID=1202772 RepID=A0A1V9Z7E8_ACHHY|nr:hypothetical protein ACHHYP_02084 [Achlya hypogyna]
MAWVSADRSIARLVLYTVANAVWSITYVVVFTVLLVWTCLEACGLRNSSVRTRSNYPLRAVSQTMWRIEIRIHGLYDTKAGLHLVAFADITASHAAWSALYFTLWRSVQAAYYEAVTSSISTTYLAWHQPTLTAQIDWTKYNIPFTLQPTATPNASLWELLGLCVLLCFCNWLAVAIYVWATKQCYYWIFGQLVVAQVDGTQHPLLPTRHIDAQHISPPSYATTGRPHLHNSSSDPGRATGPTPYLLPFKLAPRPTEPLGPPPPYDPSLAAMASTSTSSQASEPGVGPPLPPSAFCFTLVQRHGAIGFPVPPPPDSTSSPQTTSVWGRIFPKPVAQPLTKLASGLSSVHLRKPSDDFISVDAPLEDAPRITIVPSLKAAPHTAGDDQTSPERASPAPEVTGNRAPSINEAPLLHTSEEASSGKGEAADEAAPVADDPASPLCQARVVRSQVLEPLVNCVTLRLSADIACQRGMALLLGLPLRGGEVRRAFVIIHVDDSSVDVRVEGASEAAQWFCGATAGSLVTIYGLVASRPASPSTIVSTQDQAEESDYPDAETGLGPEDKLLLPSEVQRANEWASPLAYAQPTFTYDVMSPTGADDLTFASDGAPAYDVLSPRAEGAFALPRASRTIASEEPQVADRVHFTAYAPATVVTATTFRLGIWAFLVHQRDEMHEEATADGATQLSRDVLARVRRGALVHVTLSVPDGFRVRDESTKSFEWVGAVTSVFFDVDCLATAIDGTAMFTASIVVAAEVLRLRVGGDLSSARGCSQLALDEDIRRLIDGFRLQSDHTTFAAALRPVTVTERWWDTHLVRHAVATEEHAAHTAVMATRLGEAKPLATVHAIFRKGIGNPQLV